MKSLPAWGLAFPILVAAGCVAGPDYQRPSATTIPPAYGGAPNEWRIGQPQAHLPKGPWWQIFRDDDLNLLEEAAEAASQELKAAAARFDLARAVLGIARAGLMPNLRISAAASRIRDSFNRPQDGKGAGHSETYSSFSVPLELGYEVDLWGRVRRAMEAASARSQADAADLESVKLTIQADLAIHYFRLRSLDAEARLLSSTMETFQKALALTRNRRAGGVATDLDVSQAETVLRTTEAQLPAIALERVKLAHAIAVLAGQNPTTFRLPEKTLEPAPPSIPAGVPSELLQRRPDIAAAERRMAEANAGIGVARTAFFPALRLMGTAGLQSVDAGTLFNWPSRLWAVGPSLTVPLFDGGRNRAGLQQAKAVYDERVAQYRQSVLIAFSEVEDHLAAQQYLTAEHEAQTGALESARRTLAIATNRYHAGLVTYLEVATAQSAALDRERATVQLRGQQLVAAVALVKSVGGSWENPGQTAR